MFAAIIGITIFQEQLWGISSGFQSVIIFSLVIFGTWLFQQTANLAMRWSSPFPRNYVFAGLVVCVLGGIFLSFVIPILRSVVLAEHSLQLAATGEKNPESLGSEIRLQAIRTDGKKAKLDLSRICSGDWRFEDETWVTDASQSNKLVCKFLAIDRMKIELLGEDHSGVVLVAADQQPTMKKDLYAASKGAVEILLDLQTSREQASLSAMIKIFWGLWIGWLLFTAGLFLIQRPTANPNEKAPNSWWVYSLILSLVWGIYLIAFWPGIVGPDAQDQLSQAATGWFNDWHPAFHTLTLWFFTRVWNSPAMIVIIQILSLALLVGWILGRHRERNTPFWMIAFILVMLCLPPFGLAVVSLWKDIPFSIAFLGFTTCILLIIESEGKWIQNPVGWLSLGLTGTLAALFRHNGAPGVMISLGALVLAYPKYRKMMLRATSVTVLLVIGVRGPIYQLAGIERGSTNPGLQLALSHLIARHTRAETPMLPAERKLLASIREDNGKWPYNCYSNNLMAFDGKIDLANLRKSTPDLIRLAYQLSQRNPSETAKHLICNGAFIFRVLPPRSGNHYSTYEASPLNLNEDNTPAAINNPGVPITPNWLGDLLYRATNWLFFNKLNWFFWRNPFWMYLLIFAIGIAAIRTGRWQYSLLILPVLLSTLPLAVISFIQAFRLVMPMILVSLLFSGYLLVRDRW